MLLRITIIVNLVIVLIVKVGAITFIVPDRFGAFEIEATGFDVWFVGVNAAGLSGYQVEIGKDKLNPIILFDQYPVIYAYRRLSEVLDFNVLVAFILRSRAKIVDVSNVNIRKGAGRSRAGSRGGAVGKSSLRRCLTCGCDRR